ncbi:MAG TPA: hypothetical protein VEA69_06720 [Tepidisphaeraceae bacterium]|nr:hypothetical protein [Tepidisphaeraceae bacterium]
MRDPHPDATDGHLRRLLAALPGLPLTAFCAFEGFAVTFDFGTRNRVVARSGWAYASDVSLHVQCGWRLAFGELVMVGSDDAHQPPAEPGSGAADRMAERVVELNPAVLGSVVRRARAGPGGRLELRFVGGLVLDVVPLASPALPDDAHWRLIEAAGARVHVVAEARGLRAEHPGNA